MIHHDLLHVPRRGSDVKSDNTHTISDAKKRCFLLYLKKKIIYLFVEKKLLCIDINVKC